MHGFHRISSLDNSRLRVDLIEDFAEGLVPPQFLDKPNTLLSAAISETERMTPRQIVERSVEGYKAVYGYLHAKIK